MTADDHAWHGVAFRRAAGRGRRLSAEMLAVAWVMYTDGHLTVAQIAHEMDVSAGTMSVYLRELRAAKGGMGYLTRISPRGQSHILFDETETT